MLKKLILAAEYMDKIFWTQAYPEGIEMKKALEASKDPGDKDYLRAGMLSV